MHKFCSVCHLIYLTLDRSILSIQDTGNILTKPLIQIRNDTGPNPEPCDIPIPTLTNWDFISLFVLLRLNWKHLIQLRLKLLMPYLDSLYKSFEINVFTLYLDHTRYMQDISLDSIILSGRYLFIIVRFINNILTEFFILSNKNVVSLFSYKSHLVHTILLFYFIMVIQIIARSSFFIGISIHWQKIVFPYFIQGHQNVI